MVFMILLLAMFDPENGWLFTLLIQSAIVGGAVAVRVFMKPRGRSPTLAYVKAGILFSEVVGIAIVAHLISYFQTRNSDYIAIFWILLALKSIEISTLAFINNTNSLSKSERVQSMMSTMDTETPPPEYAKNTSIFSNNDVFAFS